MQIAFIGVIGAIGSAMLIANLEHRYPDPAPLIEEEVHQRRQALMQIPCLYVCQKYHDHEPCGRRQNTQCSISADLTRNK